MKKIISIACVAALVSAALTGEASPITHHRHVSEDQHAIIAPEQQSPIDINIADAQKLSTLKGIGVKKAEAIVDYRKKHGNFKSLNDLATVRGIGEKSLQRIIKNNPNRLVINP